MDIKKNRADEGAKDDRETCKYGSECYQKNPEHRTRFQHPHKRPSDESITSSRDKKMKVDELPGGHNISDSSDDDAPSTCEKDVTKLNGNTCDDNTGEDLIIVRELSGDDKAKLKELYVVEFPDDLFSFYEYCKTVYSKSPKTALRDIGLELVGPFDYLSGDIKSCTGSQIIRHYRYFYDPPEFFTVLKSTNSEFHFGYFFDDPDKPPVFLASNDPSESCTLKIVAANLFGAVNSHITSYLKASDPFKKMKIQKFQNSLTKWAKENKFTLETSTAAMRSRNTASSSKTFHRAGLVVPYDKKTDVGYRKLAENDKTLEELFTKIVESDSETERSVRWSKLQHVITYAEIAADECDFGTCLELGIDMFCQGHKVFHKTATQLMSTAYNLLGRHHFTKVIKVHLKNRVKGSNLNFATSK